MGSIDDAPQMMYPAPLDAARGTHVPSDSTNGTAPTIDITTPILIVGGGPVGMLQALMLTRLYNHRVVLLEREPTTTIYPKMEYTNGHTMEFYRALGLAESLREFATKEVPESAGNDELNLTSLAEGGKVVYKWKHEGALEQRELSRERNDGSQYLEPHLRCHQILIERWLKERVQKDKRIESYWGVGFVGLEETKEGVVSEARRVEDGAVFRIKSDYVIGCDGGGSWVRKSVGLESKRNYLEMTVAFVHFRSATLRKAVNARFPRFWHANTIGGGILVSQNEDDLWTIHLIVPPGMDPANIPTEDIIALTIGGCKGPSPVATDEIYCRGVWKTEVAIADAFRSAIKSDGTGGRVFLAGDAAHQLSPVGGHGLNSGLGDALDLAWKLSAVMGGWGGEPLLAAYDAERRQIAFENLGHVQQALNEVAFPIFMSHLKLGADKLFGEGDECDQARAEVAKICQENDWLHNQNGNMLGYYYKDSEILVADREEGAKPPEHHHIIYTPSTWPGARAPHVWMQKGGSTIDELNRTGFTAVDFSQGGALSGPFVAAAGELGVPLKVVDWAGEENVRKVYERDLVLVRPDGHVAWRCNREAGEGAVGVDEAKSVLRTVSGQIQA